MMALWWLLAAGLALGVVVVAYRLGALDPSGALAAWVEGTFTLALGGPVPAMALIAFFASSSLLTRVATRGKAVLAAEYAKGGRRDWGQVVANGGLATVLAVGLGLASPFWRPWLLLGLMGALAAATADTWATELGSLAPAPRLITTGRIVPPGTSGGVSARGLLASLAGGLFVGGVVAVFTRFGWPVWNPAPQVNVLLLTGMGGLAGLTGSVTDSLLGATAQAMYWCPQCKRETERQVHRCGGATVHVRGYTWISNDVVNFAATLVGSIMAVAMAAVAVGLMV